jgi:hypothetical protein
VSVEGKSSDMYSAVDYAGHGVSTKLSRMPKERTQS